MTTIPWLDGPWTRYGVLMSDPLGSAWYQTPTVIKDGYNWKMWYNSDNDVHYATATSPYGPWLEFGRTANLAGYSGPVVRKVGSTYHMFVANTNAHTPPWHEHLTSTDGITWTGGGVDLLPPGTGTDFDGSIARWNAWQESDGTWASVYEAIQILPAPAQYYTVGVATAADPDGPWTKYSGNPVLGGRYLCVSPSGAIAPVDGIYYMWFHGNCKDINGLADNLPTDAARAIGTTLYNWTADPISVLTRATADEGVGLPTGQIADICVVPDGDTVYMFYAANPKGSGPPAGAAVIKLATAPMLVDGVLPGTALFTVVEEVNRKLRQYKFWLRYTTTGDGVTTDFMLPCGNVVSSSDTVTVAGAATTDYTLAPDSGAVSFNAAPEAAAAIVVRCQCQRWTDDDVVESLDAAINYFAYLFPVEDVDESLTASSSTYEYALPDTVGWVKRVEVGGSSGGFVPCHQKTWETITKAGVKYLRFFSPPTEGTIRVVSVTVPTDLTSAMTSLSEAGIKNAALHAVILWAAGDILQTTVAQKLTDNAFMNAEGGQALRMIDVQRGVNSFFAAAEQYADRASRPPRFNRL